MVRKRILGILALLIIGVGGQMAGLPSGIAATINYQANLDPLNNSGVRGIANLTLNDTTNTLLVTINATGLVPNQPHPQHIHGLLGGLNSTVPTLACCDTDSDGFVEVLEGARAYGPVVLNLTSPPGFPGDHGDHTAAFPTAPGGIVNFSQLYDLSDPHTFTGLEPPLGANTGVTALFPLDNRHIVLHGLTVGAGIGAGTPGEVDGTAGYKAALPVANGEIFLIANGASGGGGGGQAVPEPGTLGLMATGMAIGWIVRRRLTL